MRNGGSLSPKCSRYSATLFFLAVHSGITRRAVDAEQLCRLADVAVRQAQRGLDVAALPGFQRLVEVERRAALELAQRLLHQVFLRIQGNFGLQVQFRLELGEREALAGVLG